MESVIELEEIYFKLFSFLMFYLLRFIIKEKALTMSDLDDIWAAQAGKHEVSSDIYLMISFIYVCFCNEDGKCFYILV